jgi:hypothetical protein
MNINAAREGELSEQVETNTHQFGDWLSIEEVVLLSTELGLPRTPKTIRKWAARSFGSPEGQAEVIVRKKDTTNGFRWMLERVSVERKIQEEINLLDEADEMVATGANRSEPEQIGGPTDTKVDEPRPDPSQSVGIENLDEDFLRNQIDNKDKQIEQLNQMISRKDDQIEALLDRDLETNILVQGLQRMLSNTLGIEAPNMDRSAIAKPQVATEENSRNSSDDIIRNEIKEHGAGEPTANAEETDGV